MFFIDNDQAKVWKRCKDSGTGSDHDIDITPRHLAPGVVSFAVGQTGMQHGQTHIMLLKPAAETSDELRCQSNLRHEHQSLSTLLQNPGNRSQIDFGFAAPRHPMQQERLERG